MAIGSSPSADTGVGVSSRPPGILTPPATLVAIMSLTVRPAGFGSFSPGIGGGGAGAPSINLVRTMKSLNPSNPASVANLGGGRPSLSFTVPVRPPVNLTNDS